MIPNFEVAFLLHPLILQECRLLQAAFMIFCIIPAGGQKASVKSKAGILTLPLTFPTTSPCA
jgi:hypothetical protein